MCLEEEKYFFFTLPYWEDHKLRHNLDVMHIEKNVMDNILGTVLNLKDWTKDNYKYTFIAIPGEVGPGITNDRIKDDCFMHNQGGRL